MKPLVISLVFFCFGNQSFAQAVLDNFTQGLRTNSHYGVPIWTMFEGEAIGVSNNTLNFTGSATNRRLYSVRRCPLALPLWTLLIPALHMVPRETLACA